jgi:hypothetical protein
MGPVGSVPRRLAAALRVAEHDCRFLAHDTLGTEVIYVQLRALPSKEWIIRPEGRLSQQAECLLLFSTILKHKTVILFVLCAGVKFSLSAHGKSSQ